MTINSMQEIANIIAQKDNYILVGHAIPDGDCIGSLLGLYLGLAGTGKHCQIWLEDPVPHIYRYLRGTEKIATPVAASKGSIIIYLDCSDARRVGERVFTFLEQDTCSINIDHHSTNEFFALYNLVDTQAAATAEIIFRLLKCLHIPMDRHIASALYTGILMDTGRFCYSNTTSQTLRIAAELLEAGVDQEAARINLFESRPPQEMHLLSQALQSLEISSDGKIAWMTLSYDQVKNLGALEVYPEDVINYTRMIAGVKVGLLFRETSPGLVKIGFRSKDTVDVAAIAAQWGGGGHKQAAGARQSGTLEEIKARVIASVRDVIR